MRHAPGTAPTGPIIDLTAAGALRPATGPDPRSSPVTELDPVVDPPASSPTATATGSGPALLTPATFDARFDELAELSYRLAYRMLGSREDARDIAQEAMARAYARWPKVRDAAPGWVARVSTNLALDLIRKRRRRPPDPPPSGTDPIAGVAERDELVAALRTLPRRQRDVVALRYLADLPEAEVARALGCSVGTVKQHAHRGLAALRVSLTSLPVPSADAPAASPSPSSSSPLAASPPASEPARKDLP